MISLIYVAERDLDRMREEKGDKYKWETDAATYKESTSRVSSSLGGELRSYLTIENTPLMLQCLRCKAHFFLEGCQNCKGGRMHFDSQKITSTNIVTSIQCMDCGESSSTWSCPKCGTKNPLCTTDPRVYTIFTLREKGCFIATAVYGSYSEPEVVFLREFRDKILLHSYLEKIFVRFYYLVSPPIADFISSRDSVKEWVKSGIVAPIVHYVEKKQTG